MENLMLALGAVIGAIVGTVVTYFSYSRGVEVGVLKIDRSNPEKDVYRFVVNDIDKMAMKKRIVLKVDANADLSQK